MNKWPAFWILLFYLPGLCYGNSKDYGQHSPAFTGSFIENKGQWDAGILYRADLPYGALFLEKTCLTYTFLDQDAVQSLLSYKFIEEKKKKANPPPGGQVAAHAYKIRFSGSDGPANISTSNPYPEYYNYFIGNDPSRWTSRNSLFQSITYHEIYAGIDLQLIKDKERLKYNFFLQPGSDINNIKLEYQGINDIKIKNGRLIISTSVNTLEELSPVAWQTDREGKHHTVTCKFVLKGNTAGFAITGDIDRDLPLVIDPILVFSSYTGSPVDNWGYTATYDNKGFLYTGGNAFVIGYPTVTGSYQLNYGGGSSDIVISKFDTTGSFMIYSTYLGGSGTEVPASLVVNNNDELFVMGTSGSVDYPVTNAAYSQVFHGGSNYVLTFILNYISGSDLVVSKLSGDGTSLLASTYFGGSGNDGLNGSAVLKHNYADDVRGEIKLDEDQNVYVCSSTYSSDLPVSSNAMQPFNNGQQDACVARLDPSLTYLLWSTYLGGSGDDAGYSLIIDDAGRVYAAGGTTSQNFPVTPFAWQTTYQGGPADGYICCLNDNASTINYSTYLGSSAYDQVFFVDKDKLGNIYVLGQTGATGNTFIFNASWSLPGGGQFITKLIPNLSSLVFSTTFGTGNGGPDISPTAFMIDNCNYIYLSGWGGASLNGFGGTSGLPVTPDAFQTTTDGKDYYFLVMEGDASGLVYATFFGGASSEHVDGGTSRFDKKGRIYQSVCAGCGGFDDFPTTPNAWSNENGSTNCNNGVIKFDFKIPLIIADFISPPAGCAPDTVSFQNTSYWSGTGNVQYSWNFGDGDVSTDKDPTHIYPNEGIYEITLIVTAPGSCNYADTVKHSIYVLGNPSVMFPEIRICKNESVQIGINPLADPTLSYTWFPSFNLNNPSISNPIARPMVSTVFYLLISNGICADTVIQPVRVYDLQVDAGNDTIICTSSIPLTARANEDSVFFQWSTNPQFSDTLNADATDSIVTVNIQNQVNWFYVRIYNDYCSAIDSIKVAFSIFISPGGGQNPLCPDSCDGAALVSLSGGSPPFTYAWNNGDTTNYITGLCAGTYTVTVTDSVNCISVASITLLDPPDVEVTLTKTDIPCTEICNGSLFATVEGGTPPYHYQWNTGDNTININNLCAGNYWLSVTDQHLCPDSDSISIIVNSIFIDIHAYAEPDSIYQGLSTQLFVDSLQGCTYHWSPAAGLSDISVNNPVATPVNSTVYYVTITDAYGCQYIDSVKVITKEVICREPYIFIPNAFTPNGDNKNDVILVQGNFIDDLHLAIYDRWGNRVFETTDPGLAWDGRFNGQICEPGVYVFYLDVGCFNKERFKKQGNITLIR